MNALMEKILTNAEAREKTVIEKEAYTSAENMAPWFDEAN